MARPIGQGVDPRRCNPDSWEPAEPIAQFRWENDFIHCSTAGCSLSAKYRLKGVFKNFEGRRASRRFCQRCADKLPPSLRPKDGQGQQGDPLADHAGGQE